MSEKFCLKWNDFHSNVSKSFSKLRNEDTFYDVTLVSDDQKTVSAHKVVLSACSEYFKNILKQNPHSNPLLCLEGLSNNDINNILDYIYYGEVSVHQEEVEKFLNIAERLKLEGLISTDSEIHDNYDIKYQEGDEEAFVNINDAKELVLDDDDAYYEKVKSENNSLVMISNDFQSIEELDAKILEYMERDVGSKWKCKLCDKVMRAKHHIREHVEIHFEGISFPCQFCDVVPAPATRSNLRNHVIRKHKSNKS